jgi:hypothetical protein
MHLLGFTYISALSLMAVVNGIPAPDIVERQPSPCKTVLPQIARVSEAQPVESYLPGFIISQEQGGTKRNDMFAEFSIPAGSWGCTLSYYFPAGYPVEVSGSPWIDVHSVQGPLSRSPRGIDISWAYCPAPIYMVGTTRFESSPSQSTKRVINSFGCASVMTYRFSIGKYYSPAARVKFEQNSNAGLRMTYGC